MKIEFLGEVSVVVPEPVFRHRSVPEHVFRHGSVPEHVFRHGSVPERVFRHGSLHVFRHGSARVSAWRFAEPVGTVQKLVPRVSVEILRHGI